MSGLRRMMMGMMSGVRSGEFIYLCQPFGLVMSPEFLGIYFVSQEDPQNADQTIYQFYNNF